MSAETSEKPGADDGQTLENPKQDSRLLRIQILKSKNLPEGSNTTISYTFQLKPKLESEESEQFTLSGTTEPLEEGAQGTENKYNFQTEHPLEVVDGAVLKTFITAPLVFNVEGLSSPGKVSIPLKNLVWRPKPTLDDPDEDEFLPEFPGD